MSAANPFVVAPRRPPAKVGAWELIASGVGYHLDNLGRWLIAKAPNVARTYATLLTPRAPKIGYRPGWRFAEEYYDQRRWLACRRGALWETAAKKNAFISLILPWYDGIMVDVTLGNDNSLCLYVCGSYEPNEFAFLSQLLKSGMVFIDVGANDGYFTLFAAARVGQSGKVVAVEPSSRERVNLLRNVRRNGAANVTVVPSALGATVGEADLRLAQGVHSGHNTLGDFVHDDVIAARLERVDVDTLDDVVQRLGLLRIDFIKIDVEGAEANVIAGGRETLRTMQPVLLMEINEQALRAQGNGAEALLATLRAEFGYEILIFSPTTGHIEPLVEDAPLSANVVAAPKERIHELLDRA